MRITYSPRAAVDLAEIGDYIAQHNPHAAVAVERRIRTIVELIARFPLTGRMIEERIAVRVMPLGNYPYRIFYMTADDELIVLHIRHSAREPLDPNQF
ncbi:MAG: type II toxin-antitoxin system RelE/ParE family toxin [Methyloceanibacter sp.]